MDQKSSFLHNAARGKNKAIFYLITVFLVVVAFLGGGFVFDVALVTVVGIFTHQNLFEQRSLLIFIAGMLPFIFGLVVLYLCVKLLHQRRFMSLINTTGKFRWRRLFKSAAVWFVIALGAELVNYLIHPQNYTFNFHFVEFLISCLLVFAFIPFQIGFEELFVRGYIMQGFGSIFKKPFWPIVFSSILFALAHVPNQEFSAYGFVAMFAYFVIVGLQLALLTYLDNGLEYALGVHLANNIFAFLIVYSPDNQIPIQPLFLQQHVDIYFSLLALCVGVVLHFIFTVGIKPGKLQTKSA